MPGSEKISNVHGNPFSNMKEDESLRESRDIVHVLTYMLSNPLSLKHLCRVQIRRSLGKDFHRKLHQLNVPLPLQEYLMIYKPVSDFEQDGGTRQKDFGLTDPTTSAAVGACSPSQWAHDAITTSLWWQNNAVTWFWCHNNVVIVPCVRWEVMIMNVPASTGQPANRTCGPSHFFTITMDEVTKPRSNELDSIV